MVFERTENEPEEYDPEAELTDPESDSLTIPAVSTDETDAPPELLKAFWAIVLVVNVAVLGVSLGALFLVFESDVSTGGPLLGGGIVLFGFAYYRYRSFRRSYEPSDADSVDNPSDTDSGGGESDTGAGETTSAPDDSDPARATDSSEQPARTPNERVGETSGCDSAEDGPTTQDDHDRNP